MNTIDTLAIDNGQLAPGIVAAANASRFNEAHFSQPLTTYAQRSKETYDLEEALNLITGTPVPAPMRFEYATFENAEDFLTETNDLRARGSEFKKVAYRSDKAYDRLDNRGLTLVLDKDDIEDDPMAEERATARLRERLLRNELIRAIALLDAAATNTAKTWDTTAGKDPDQDVLSDLITAADSSGVRPNRVAYGETAWNKRGLAHRAQETAGGFASAGMTPEQVAGLVMADRVGVIKNRYQSSLSAKTQTLGNLVLMYLAVDGANTDDPSNIKRFVKNTGMRVYRQDDGGKFIQVTVEHYSKIAITSTLGIRKFTVS